MASITKKAPVKKTPVKKEAVEASVAVATPKKRAGSTRSLDVFDVSGKVVESVTLPENIFGVAINKKLLSQAVRVYLANQRTGTASTKSRGEVRGSTRKIYRQKGTGRARHGGVRAPIFVKGGVAHGPRPHDFSLVLPQKMRTAALCSALSAKVKDGEVFVIAGLLSIDPKTKIMAGALSHFITEKKRKVLLVTADDTDTVKKATRNLDGVTFTSAGRLNPYEVLVSKQVVFMKEAVDALSKRVVK